MISLGSRFLVRRLGILAGRMYPSFIAIIAAWMCTCLTVTSPASVTQYWAPSKGQHHITSQSDRGNQCLPTFKNSRQPSLSGCLKSTKGWSLQSNFVIKVVSDFTSQPLESLLGDRELAYHISTFPTYFTNIFL